MKTNKTLTELLIELDQVNKNIERIRTDDEYIAGKVREIYGNKRYTNTADLKKVIELVNSL